MPTLSQAGIPYRFHRLTKPALPNQESIGERARSVGAGSSQRSGSLSLPTFTASGLHDQGGRGRSAYTRGAVDQHRPCPSQSGEVNESLDTCFGSGAMAPARSWIIAVYKDLEVSARIDIPGLYPRATGRNQ